MNYPHDKVELLFICGQNCSDSTYEECLSVQALPEYEGRNIRNGINRKGTVNSEKRAFLMMRSRWQKVIIFVFMMRMPCLKRMHFTFLVKEVLKDAERRVAAFGRNKTRNAKQNFLTRCINPRNCRNATCTPCWNVAFV